MKRMKPLFSVLLALCLLLGVLPLPAHAAEAHTHCHCLNSYDSDYCAATHNASQKWTAWSSTTSLPSSAGYYYLTADVSLNYTWTPPTGIRLCLNNHTITHTKTTGSVMKVTVTNVVLTDCTPGNQVYTGGIRYGNGTTVNGKTCGGGIYVDGGYLYIYRTDIRHNDADYGGGIYITGNGSVNLYSRASLNQNGAGFADGAGKKATYGGNIYMDYGWLKTFSCEILNGSATSAGGGVYMKGVSCYMDHYASVGGIHANRVTGSTGSGGGVYVGSSAYLNIHGSGYIGTNSAPTGGGVYVSGHLSMDGGSISQNSATIKGGGIYLEVGSDFTATAGYIGSNTCSAADGGGGIYARSSAIKLSGEPRIINNTAKGSANNLKLNDATHRSFTLTGPLSGKANICVSANTGVDFSKEWNTYMGSTYPETYVHSDLSGYDVIQNTSSKELTLGVHEHDWTYTSATTYQTSDTLSEACACGEGGSLYLTAPELTAGSGSAEVTVTGSLDNPVVTPVIYYEGTGSTSYSKSTTAPTALGTYRASLTVDGATAYVNYTLAVPTVTEWPTAAEITYGQTLADSALTGGTADVSGTFAWTDGSVKPAVGTASFEVTFTPADSSYTAVTQTVSVTVNQAEITVTKWPTALELSYGNPLSDSVLWEGEASVPGTFAWKNPDHVPEAGIYTGEVIFTPTDSGYKSVTGTVSVTVNKKDPDITTWPTASDLIYGQTLADSTLTGGSADVPGTFAWVDSSILPEVGTKTYHVTFTPTDSKNHSVFTEYVSVTVLQAKPAVTAWPTASDITYGDTLADSALKGGEASVSGTFAWTDSTVKPAAGTASYEVTFTPEDENYASVTQNVSLTVSQADAGVTAWPTASDITYGQTLADSALEGGEASVPGTFAWTDITVKPTAGTASYEVTFTPADDGYASATQTVSVTTAQADPAVTKWPTAADITYGSRLSASALTGGEAAVPGTFAWKNIAEKPSAGTASFEVVFTPDDAANYKTVTQTVEVTVYQGESQIITKPTVEAFTYGTALKDIELTGGKADLEGSFSWKDPDLVPEAGTQILEAVFTPADENYAPVTVTIAVNVQQADAGVTVWPTASDITYGDTLADSALTGGEAAVEGTFAWADGSSRPVAGSCNATVIFTPADNNYAESTSLVSVTVRKATPGISWTQTGFVLKYTGKPAEISSPNVTLVGDDTFDGTILYSYTAADAAARAAVWTSGLPTEVGTWTVRASVTETANYNAAYADIPVTIQAVSEGGEGSSTPESGGTTGGSGTVTPPTGDTAMPLLMLFVLLLSGAALPMLLQKTRKNRT